MDGDADARASTGPIASPRDDDDDDDDDAFGARAGIRDGTMSLMDDVLEARDDDERDDETRATAIDADASLAEMFLHYSTRDAASDVSRRASSRARRDRVVAFDATRYRSSCKQHLSAERFPGAHRKTCTTCLRLHKAYQRRRRKRTKLCDENESRRKP